MDGSNQVARRRATSRTACRRRCCPTASVVYTEWRHLGNVNDGHLRMMNTDMTGMREAFGGEGRRPDDQQLPQGPLRPDHYQSRCGRRHHELPDGRHRHLARPHAAGGQAAAARPQRQRGELDAADLTPLVPGDRDPRSAGRRPLLRRRAGGRPAPDRKFLVSWADGPVESEPLAHGQDQRPTSASTSSTSKQPQRFPIYDDPNTWDVPGPPGQARPEPRLAADARRRRCRAAPSSIGALNVYDSSLFNRPRAGQRARSASSRASRARRASPTCSASPSSTASRCTARSTSTRDGSFAAMVPANVPLHMQLIDKFGHRAWPTSRSGSAAAPASSASAAAATRTAPRPRRSPPGITETCCGRRQPRTPAAAPVGDRVASQATTRQPTQLRGVPWDKALQPILDAKCISCHDGDATARRTPATRSSTTPTWHVADVHLRPARAEDQRHRRRAR